MNNKKELKPIFEKAVKSNPEYKALLNNIIKSENDVRLVYNWEIGQNKNDPKEIEKVLKVIGDLDFSKLCDMEFKNSKVISFGKSFKNYPNYNFETVKNLFEAHTDGAYSEGIDDVIFYLYKRNDVKPIIEKVSNSNPKYKEKLNSIIEYESQ